MNCPECNKNGISAFSKLGLIFDIEFRCGKCGALFGLNLGLYCVLDLLFQALIVVSIICAFIYLKAYLAYLVLAVSFVLLSVLTLFLPIKVKSKLRVKHRRS